MTATARIAGESTVRDDEGGSGSAAVLRTLAEQLLAPGEASYSLRLSTLNEDATPEHEARAQLDGFIAKQFALDAGDAFAISVTTSTFGRLTQAVHLHSFSSEVAARERDVVEELNGVQWIGDVRLNAVALRRYSFSTGSNYERDAWREWQRTEAVIGQIKKKRGSWRLAFPQSAWFLQRAMTAAEVAEFRAKSMADEG